MDDDDQYGRLRGMMTTTTILMDDPGGGRSVRGRRWMTRDGRTGLDEVSERGDDGRDDGMLMAGWTTDDEDDGHCRGVSTKNVSRHR